MRLHPLQLKLLNSSDNINLEKMSLRQIGKLINEKHPQKISHHLDQLQKKGFIRIDRVSGKIIKVKRGKIVNSDLVNIPILGNANCGEALSFADEYPDGFLKISKRFISRRKNIFAIKAKGNSMNRASIKGYNIEDGDYIIVDGENRDPKNDDYILSIIDETANVKKFLVDRKKNQIALLSESTEDYPPIFIHPDDKFMINGVVKYIIKKPKVEWPN